MNLNVKILLADLSLIRKDPMLLTVSFVPVIFFFLLKFAFPFAAQFATIQWGISIWPFFNHVLVFFLSLVPVLLGMIYGFILLDERDEGIIAAISVTPWGKTGYLQTRMSLPVAYSFSVIILLQLLLQNPFNISIIQMIFVSGLMSLNAPLTTLFLGAFARNKIEGMAITKLFNLLLMAILIDFLVPAPFNWLGAVSPFFWTERAMFCKDIPSFLLYAAGAILVQSIYGYFMFQRFRKRMD